MEAVYTIADNEMTIRRLVVLVAWWRCCLGHSKNFSDNDDDDQPSKMHRI